jgi:gluconate 5-dehydrogenase
MFLSGKRALVTGSTSGIGLAIARALTAEGAEMVLNGFGDEKEIARLCDELGARHINADLTTRQGVEALMREAGAVDILVNNAGMQHRAPLEAFPEDKFEQVIRTNLTSVYLVGQAAAKRMIPRGRGKIINICSLMSGAARPSIAPYAASKAGVANLTRAMASEWARHGLNVNGIAPGFFKTELNEALVRDEKFNGWLEARTPMARWGEVEELGGAAIFLSSDAAAFVNGHILYVDGGFIATV